jgi:cyclopropane-fatty-acyl-phospholipid synthase
MELFALEQDRTTYRADFVAYGVASAALAAGTMITSPRGQWPQSILMALAGLAAWTVIEYALHRFVLHGMAPFRDWHAEHHRRPTALIGTPTILSAALIAALVFLPLLVLGDARIACALTFGVVTGYLAYLITHYATHHWRGDNAWIKRRKRWHAMHHRPNMKPGCYGVTSTFWDHVFRSTSRAQR